MSGSFSRRTGTQPEPGIPVTRQGDPYRKTLVVCPSIEVFEKWCKASFVNPGSKSVMFVTSDFRQGWKPPYTSELANVTRDWEWVVFVTLDPRDMYLPGPAFSELETRRQAREFTRAWVFMDLEIVPELVEGESNAR